MKILITGSAGFIGYHLCNTLLNANHQVIGFDSINDYYDIDLKYNRLNNLGITKEKIEYSQKIISSKDKNFSFYKANLEDEKLLNKIFKEEKFDVVCNLAAQAGVRYSITNPHAYISSNIIGFTNILEAVRHNNIKHLVYASSSSVYGLNSDYPFSTTDKTDTPISLYAATKKSNELMAHTYTHLYGINTIGLRFFTVYGPWGRPDMALYIFAKNILENKQIEVYNNGNMQRDFTYIDDIIGGVSRCIESDYSNPKYKIYNIGQNSPIKLMDFVKAIETKLNKKANIKFMPMQMGDVQATYANVDDLIKDFNYKPSTSIEYGIDKFIDWFKEYHANS
jgi:UDP-glucuronate 4-epimerase